MSMAQTKRTAHPLNIIQSQDKITILLIIDNWNKYNRYWHIVLFTHKIKISEKQKHEVIVRTNQTCPCWYVLFIIKIKY